MLPRQYRLRRRSAVARIRSEGRRWRHPLAILLACPAPEPMNQTAGSSLPPSRFAFSASRRVGNAVHRNRAKRLLREAVRPQLLAIQPGWDCLLIAREETPAARFDDVEAAVRHLFSRAGLLPPGGDPASEPEKMNL